MQKKYEIEFSDGLVRTVLDGGARDRYGVLTHKGGIIAPRFVEGIVRPHERLSIVRTVENPRTLALMEGGTVYVLVNGSDTVRVTWRGVCDSATAYNVDSLRGNRVSVDEVVVPHGELLFDVLESNIPGSLHFYLPAHDLEVRAKPSPDPRVGPSFA